MKGLSKPISSPGRTDKFPPPLMRFLRSNAGSRSRGRSRSSPMFMRKKNSVAIETTQEPSSPKVTCIGQVRVRRSSKSSSAAAGGISRSKSVRKTRRPSSSTTSKQQPCWWVRKLLFCRRISRKFGKPKPISSFFRKWAFFCGFGCRKIRDNTDSPPRVEPDPKAPTQEEEPGCNSTSSGRRCGGGSKAQPENKENTVGSSSSPPNYAFFLTRCRSAPYRSSSLACRFWGSPLNATEPEAPETEPENLPQEEKPSSSPRKSQETEASASSDDVKTKEEEEKEETNKVEPIGKSAVHPLLLTRCKSEPARSGERLNPDAGYWRRRRFAEPHPSS
ncbi:PREDICTED: uncharacterized protein LOC109185791 [Ipomoea nil]|uniref:uncharacterized protein LOC109185791 n=1 Tax=Ipomoea nil TaxID=35883 RepID=UPI000901BFA4|nr:PREDICTED: uncharacterized protein LOC109185791 [Ipomoea nil]